MNIYRLVSYLLVLLLLISCNAYRYSSSITSPDMERHIRYLSSDELSGRYPGTEGDVKAGIYIEDRFRDAGLEPQKQEFAFLQSVSRGENNSFAVNGQIIKDSDFTPLSFSKDTTVEAMVVFAGYGLSVKTDSVEWDDYKQPDVKGKWVMVLRGYPPVKGLEDYLSLGSEDRDKAMLAFDKGASGIIYVSGETENPSDVLSPVSAIQAKVPIPAIQIKRNIADLILKDQNRRLADIEKAIMEQRSSLTLLPEVSIKASSHIQNLMGHTYNHYAILKGSGPSANEYMVIGAHYDHLGTGGQGSSSRRPDSAAVHNGADDNASGISVMLELASMIKNRQKSDRSYIFVAFGAEEKGLLGSKYFVNHFPVDLGSVIAMINLDMVGRLDTAKGLQIGGTGTSAEADLLINNANKKALKLVLNREGSGPSDHSSFYGRNIPVFFITTGAHTDYHTPDDDADRINIEGMMEVAFFTYQLTLQIDTLDTRLSFREAGPKETTSPSVRFKVTLGFMPDFSATDIEGVKVDFVSKGKAAERGGIKNGDIITAIDGLQIKNIYDYMYRLSRLSKNQIISVEVLRDGKKEVFLIQL